MRITNKYIFFWGDWPSNWYPCHFVVKENGEELGFSSSEQYFMWKKAKTFGDEETAKKILKRGHNPRTAKALGREVRNYDNEIWDDLRYDVMVDANYYKYSQNKDLKEMLLDPELEGKHFCEASKYDTIWGIGLTEDNPLVDDEKNWLGDNLLGKVLDEVRIDLLEEKHEKN